MTTINPDWLERGKHCRNLRVHGNNYLTQRQQAEKFSLDMVALSKMENGILDPEPLERAWGIERKTP